MFGCRLLSFLQRPFVPAPQLRRSIRDIVALSTLSALWTDYTPQQIAESVSAALLSMRDADFVYVFLPEERDGRSIEILSSGKGFALESSDPLRDMLRGDRALNLERTASITNPVGRWTGELNLQHFESANPIPVFVDEYWNRGGQCVRAGCLDDFRR
jgi:hypothetical protein